MIAPPAAWPVWATGTCVALATVFALLHLLDKMRSTQPATGGKKVTPKDFVVFQREYLVVYWTVMFADWLQGPNMYTLYQSYGVDVGTLFMIGFLSSALTSGIVGHAIDTYGRKSACLVFCLLEVVINLLEHVPNFYILAVGRVLGGISTSLLFSAFESYMVAEHRRRKFPEPLLASTFALASEGNGLIAIVAGLVAQVAADVAGDIAPFQLAIAATVVAAGLIVHYWPTDDIKSTEAAAAAAPSPSRVWTWNVVAVGLSYSLFEGAMYIFVFLWVPALQHSSTTQVPVGLVFSNFMLCLAIGGKLFQRAPLPLALVCAAASICMLLPALELGFATTFGSFLLFEVCVGAYFPASATLRADIFPDAAMGATMTAFRLPTNLLVLVGTHVDAPPAAIFGLCAALHAIAGGLATAVQQGDSYTAPEVSVGLHSS
ncbi:Aste57867_11542 [Aphanomyces stellatus]|uniref:Molybdate-anion transporter n=1 Tax=Aphanomyces stellatus TaxID=120398 RepID=A0A485KUF1_9STRA|nr:hypothetical protein As57867_011499 [Aphanomyces stellatus]VFT88403.1 Aste57867_11542 [Aphanomyces stellatus]